MGLEGAKDPSEAASALAKFQSRLPHLEEEGVIGAAERLCEVTTSGATSEEVRPMAFLALRALLEAHSGEAAGKVTAETVERWLQQLEVTSLRSASSSLGLLTCLYQSGFSSSLPRSLHRRVHTAALGRMGNLDHSVATGALHLGVLAAVKLQDATEPARTMGLVGRYSQSSEPRIRHAAFLALKSACERGHRLEPTFYSRACR